MFGNTKKSRVMTLLNKYFPESVSETIIQFTKSLFVGAFATLVDMGSLFVLNKIINVHYIISTVISYILGLVVNYIITTLWVFSVRTLKNPKLEFIVFAIISLIGLALNVLIIWFMKNVFEIDVMIGKLIATVVVYIWNFAARKIILYR